MANLMDINFNDNDSLPLNYWSFGSYLDQDGRIQLRLCLYGVAIPIISLVGVIANLFNLTILRMLVKRKHASAYHILLAMAIADLIVCGGYLVSNLLLFARADPVLRFLDINQVGAPAYYLLLALDPVISTSGFISNWCTVAVAAFRFTSVYFPLRASYWCTRRRARLAVIAIVAVATLATIPPRSLYLSNVYGRTAVTSREEMAKHWQVYTVSYAIVNDLLPWILCIVLVSLLLRSICRRTNVVRASATKRKQNREKNRHLTASLLSTAAWYVVMTAPSTVSVVLSLANGENQQGSLPFIRFLYVGQVLVLMNFTGNFFFYSCMNKNYYRQLMAMTSACKQICVRSKHSVISTSLQPLVSTSVPVVSTDHF